MIIMRATGRHGGEYAYFFCRGVQDHVCDEPYTAETELARRSAVNAEQATPKGDLFSGVSVGDLLPALKVQGDCSKPPMVRIRGLEPPRSCEH